MEKNDSKETVTLKFGKGCVGKQFQGKDGNQYREILVPPDQDMPWATFVVKADQLHESRYGKGMYIKLPAKGNTTIRWSVDISPKDSQTKEWFPQQERIPNTTLKNMMEKYKERPKESIMEKLAKKKEEVKTQQPIKKNQEKSKSKEAEI